MTRVLRVPFFSLLIACLWVTLCFAQDSATSLYDTGRYSEAIDLLMKQGAQNSKNAADLYNLGNLYYRVGKPALASAYYEKANFIAPGNDDIEYNLNLARSQARKEGALTQGTGLGYFWQERLSPWAKRLPESLFWIAFTIATLIVAFPLRRASKLRQRAPASFSWSGLVPPVGIWVLLMGTWTTLWTARQATLANIIGENSIGRSGPGEHFAELERPTPGVHVRVLSDTRNGWRQVKLSNGKVAWLMEKDLLFL